MVLFYRKIIKKRIKAVEELIIPRHVREGMLRDLGYTKREIAQAVRRSLKAKNQRRQTYNNMHAEAIEYMVEMSRRRIGRLLGFGGKKELPA